MIIQTFEGRGAVQMDLEFDLPFTTGDQREKIVAEGK